MRLANLIPSVSTELVTYLNTIGIRTEIDLLFSATPWEILGRLPAGSTSLEELNTFINLVTELCAAQGTSALELLNLETEARAKDKELCTGDEQVDRLLRGLGGRKVIHISGERGSGKSTLALNIVLNHLTSYGDSTAMWLDTTGDFSVEEAVEILNTKQMSHGILERLQVSLVFDLNAAQAVIDALFQRKSGRPELLVIDIITPLLAPLLSAVSSQGHALMTELMRHLQSLAQTSGMTVLLLNGTARKSPDTQERKPALGPSFALLADTTLWLQTKREQESGDLMHSIRILSSRAKAAGGSVPFRIVSNVLSLAQG